MIFGTCKLHTTTSGVMQILSLNTLDGATYDQHDCRRQLGKCYFYKNR